jgi:serine/threonine protein kinase
MMLQLYDTNLEKWVEKNRWEERKNFVDGLFFTMLDSIIALHENGIYHMDIKSGNFLKSNEKVVLCDLGVL